MFSRFIFICVIAAAMLAPSTSAAQDVASSCTGYESLAARIEQVAPGHVRLRGQVEITCEGFKFFADQIDLFNDEHRLTAEGNVLFTNADTRISAARAEFDLEAKTGTFYDATGSSKVAPQATTQSMFGTQEAEMQFRGERLEKLGEQKYRLTRGGFTTCLQPTARWEFTSGSVVINLDHYAVARNTVFRVKGVPLLYLPIIYYPLQEDDRATGFLLPSYGNSYIQGHTLRNAFFWAINRSMDVTLMHDWFSKTGQAFGAEMRYVASPGSSGGMTASMVDERASVTVFPDGTKFERTAARNFQLQGDLTQQLPGRFRAGAQVNYFTDLNVEQLYNHNPYDFTNRQSYINANVSGQAAGLQLGAAFARREYFHSGTSSSVTGAAPRVTASRPEQTLLGLPVYWGFTSEAIAITSQTRNGEQMNDRGRTRVDVMPSMRMPLTRLTWLNAAASLSWRATWWSRSLDSVTQAILDEPLSRRYAEGQVAVTGPTFSRVFNTPDRRFAQRWKHVIEPSATLGRTTAIDVRPRILSDYDSVDLVVGSATRLNYALTNRLYAKRGEGAAGIVRELASVSVTQSFYTDATIAAADQAYRDPSTLLFPDSKFSPVTVSARITPATTTSVEFRGNYDHTTNTLRQLSIGGTVRLLDGVDLNGAWSKQRQPKGSPFADNPYYNNHSINGSGTWRSARNVYGGSYGFHYDIRNSGFINQRLTAYYNPQCCGVGIEYQKVNLPNFGGVQGRVLDRRFNVSFTLAGIGSFSDFFGAFGADPYRR